MLGTIIFGRNYKNRIPRLEGKLMLLKEAQTEAGKMMEKCYTLVLKSVEIQKIEKLYRDSNEEPNTILEERVLAASCFKKNRLQG